MKRFMKKIFAGVTVALMLISSVGVSPQFINAEEVQQGQNSVEQVELSRTEVDAELIDQDKSEENLSEPTIVHEGTDGGVTWSLDSDGLLNVSIAGDLSYEPYEPYRYGDEYSQQWPWYDYRYDIKKAKVTGKNITMIEVMFYACHSLKNVEFNDFDTSKVTDMSNMFCWCDSLESIDVSGFDTSNVTKMYGMFHGCSKIKKLDVTGFDTRKVDDISGMFMQCSGLKTVDVSKFKTEKVTDMGSIFYGCSSLTSVDVSNFDTSNVENMGSMFEGCYDLKKVDVSGFNTEKVKSFRFMFDSCYSLTSLDLSNFNIKKIEPIMYAGSILRGCDALMTIKTPKVLSDKVIIPLPTTFVNNKGQDRTEIIDANDIYTRKISVTGVKLDKKSINLKKGESVTLKATVYPQNAAIKSVKWSSSNKKVATVDNKGNVKAVSAGTATITVTTVDGSFKATCKVTVTDTVKTVTMNRLYNPNSGEHFYTSSQSEISTLVTAGWKNEGVAWKAPETSKTPVYRLYNPNAGDHHYTTSKPEKDSLENAGWKYEGIGWYSDDSKGVPLHRLYNPNATTGSHHYTTSASEKDNLVKAGWKYEGIAWYGMK